MNVFDHLFENSWHLEKDFILGASETTSYHELFRDSQKIAGFLQSAGLFQKYIPIISSNSSFFIKVYLGILKSGNICIPLNSELEKESLTYIFDKCQPEIVFIESNLSHTISGYTIQDIIDENKLKQIIADDQYKPFVMPTFNDEKFAEIIFTSGSTGKPKGVMITHRNIIANTNSIVQYLSLKDSDIIQVVLPFYYCYGLSLLHSHLRAGGSIVLTNSFIFIGTVINDLKKYKCTGFAGVPSHYQILLRKTKEFKGNTFPDLRYVTQAGGKLHNAFIEEFTACFPQINFYVMYGQTEATARLSYLPPEMLSKKIGSIGKGIPGVELMVVDNDGNLVKEGETGEIIARGDNIMSGYFQDEKATDDVIIDGWLHTGDLAHIDKDGYIFITGRKKDIIKVGGNRVSSKEIEEVILQIPTIIDCSIEGITDDILGESIKAKCIVERNANISIETIKNHCSNKLALYKIPRIIEINTEFMMNGSGKKIKPV